METLHPGIYLQEVPGENPIEGVSTSTGAFVGVTERGEVGKSGFVTSWKDFQAQYGGYLENSYLPYSVRGFFENGGTRAFISRVVHYTNNSGTFVKSSVKASKEFTQADNVIGILDALTDGTWGNDLEIDILTGEAENARTIVVYEDGQFKEQFENLIPSVVEDTINSTSKLVRYTSLDDDSPLPVGKVKLAGGNDGLTGLVPSDYIGDEALQNGLFAFDNNPINIVAIPGITDVATLAGITSYVEKRKDCTAIVEAPLGMKPLQSVEFFEKTANIASARVHAYYPWIDLSDPIGVGNNPTKLVPPSGHLMGIFARIDNTRGVWKAPAGLEAVVRGAIGLEYEVNDSEQDMMNPKSVNAIRKFDGEGIIVWGARTRSSQSEWKFINVRRSADYVGQSILAGTRWAVFENNDSVLWGKIESVSSAFLRSYWRAGALRGETESQAFFVECNASTTTPDDIDAGRLYANVGICPQKPAEFVIFRLSLMK